MRKMVVFIILSIFLICILLTSCNNEAEEYSDYSIYTKICDGFYFERISEVDNSICYAPIFPPNEIEKYIADNVVIFRYAYNSQGYIAYHWNEVSWEISNNTNTRIINSSKYEILQDYITIYKINTDEYINFENQNDFNSYCKDNALTFNWMYSHGSNSYEIWNNSGSNNWNISVFESNSLCGFVYKDGSVILEGYITEIYTNDDNSVLFKIKIPHKDILEYRDMTFENLSVSFEKSIGKHKISPLLMYEEIYYENYLMIDVTTNTIYEYEGEIDSSWKQTIQSNMET